MPDGDATLIISLFTEFLTAFGEATPAERKAFLDFIGAQSRADLLALADAIRERHYKR